MPCDNFPVPIRELPCDHSLPPLVQLVTSPSSYTSSKQRRPSWVSPEHPLFIPSEALP